MRTASAGRIIRWLVTLTLVTVAAALFAGCAGGTLSSVFSSAGGSGGKLPPVSFAPILGPPANVGNELTQQLVASAKKKKIPVVENAQPATYKVQSYLAQSNEKQTEKFTYIVDVTDTTGNRVHRITGEEIIPAKRGAQPWSSINKSAIQRIATTTTTNLAAWLSQQGGASTPVVAPARTSAAQEKPPPPKPSSPRPTTTASSRSDPVAALIPPVSGAPGDGRTSLTNALRQRLRARGVQIASTGGRNVYKINGKVSVSPAGGNKERIKIDWTLLSPTGQNLGSVTQQSDVEKGSLNRTWGPAATAAGNAAAAEILKLIEKSRG